MSGWTRGIGFADGSTDLPPTGESPTMTPRSAQALLTMATNRAPLDFRILPSATARFT
jgi:hypothetical protein